MKTGEVKNFKKVSNNPSAQLPRLVRKKRTIRIRPKSDNPKPLWRPMKQRWWCTMVLAKLKPTRIQNLLGERAIKINVIHEHVTNAAASKRLADAALAVDGQ